MSSGDLWQSLAEYKSGDGEEEFDLPDDASVPLERPKDERVANAMMRTLVATQREIGRIDALATADIDHTKAWRADLTAGLLRRVAQLERALEQYARAVLEGRTKNKTLTYPSGSLSLRAGAQTFRVVEEDKTKAWATASDERKALFVETSVTLKSDMVKSATKPGPALEDETEEDGTVYLRWAAVTEDGEAVPGVVYRKRKEDNFSAKPA